LRPHRSSHPKGGFPVYAKIQKICNLVIMSEQEKNPKEASNIFHSIMKASVSKPEKTSVNTEDLKERFERYLTELHVNGLNSTDKFTRSRYFNGKVDEFYQKEIGSGLSRNELAVLLSPIRVKFQIIFIEN